MKYIVVQQGICAGLALDIFTLSKERSECIYCILGIANETVYIVCSYKKLIRYSASFGCVRLEPTMGGSSPARLDSSSARLYSSQLVGSYDSSRLVARAQLGSARVSSSWLVGSSGSSQLEQRLGSTRARKFVETWLEPEA